MTYLRLSEGGNSSFGPQQRLVNTVIKLWALQNAENFLTSQVAQLPKLCIEEFITGRQFQIKLTLRFCFWKGCSCGGKSCVVWELQHVNYNDSTKQTVYEGITFIAKMGFHCLALVFWGHWSRRPIKNVRHQIFIVQYLKRLKGNKFLLYRIYAKTLSSGTVTLSVRGSTNGSLGHCNNYRAQIDLTFRNRASYIRAHR